MSRYLSNSIRGRLAQGMSIAALMLAGGCAGVNSMMPGTAVSHLEYMNRAASAGPEVREAMKQEAERQSEQQPLTTKLHIAFLLTSPGENESDTQAGKQMLKQVLAERTGLTPTLKALIELRLQEVEARQSLHAGLREAETKIEDLMSIESSMERKKSKSQPRPR